MARNRRALDRTLLFVTAAGIAAGLAAYLAGAGRAAEIAWAATTAVALLPLTVSVARTLLRGHTGVDVIALLAMAGALILGQYLAGAVIALMLTGGLALEEFASRRAERELKSLLERAPRIVHREEAGKLTSPPLEEVERGDVLLVKPGEVVPVDGTIAGTTAVLDESALTGESLPVERAEGERVRSGTVNAASSPFRMVATATAEASTYAGVVRLVQEARESKPPLVRLADRYAGVFLPVTLAVAGLAWIGSGEALRALAVLVVATPCPLILAAPIAMISGVSRAARRGVLVKGGAPFETLARGRLLVLDKTGTVTAGAPEVTDIETFSTTPADEVLRLAASLDLVSPHVLATAIVRAARARGLELSFPTEVTEELGSGISGKVGGRSVALGKREWAIGRKTDLPAVRRIRRRNLIEGSSGIFVAVDGKPAGALILQDPIRTDAPRTLRALRRGGFERIIMLTGDHLDLAEAVGTAIGVDRVYAERTPAEKVAAVREVAGEGVTVMVGDGINDAPALAAADVGVAMGARGATASSEAADVVLVVDRLDRLLEGVRAARRSRGIALQSILAGMGFSFLAMGVAAFGFLPPVAGAILQEGIDVAVILNALRALREGRRRRNGAGAETAEVARQLREEHKELLPKVLRIRETADRLDHLDPGAARAELTEVYSFLADHLLPHERAEDAAMYPVVAKLIGGEDPTATMSRAHSEIEHLVRVLGRLLDDLPKEGPGPEDLPELRRILYGLHAILQLHFAQEEETYLSLMDERAPVPRPR